MEKVKLTSKKHMSLAVGKYDIVVWMEGDASLRLARWLDTGALR